MNRINFSLVILLAFLVNIQSFTQESVILQYISPVPGSELNSRETNIIFGCAESVNDFSLNKNFYLAFINIFC